MGILYTTHYMEEAERLCDRVGIIDEGRIIAEGTPPRARRARRASRTGSSWPPPATSGRRPSALRAIDGVREATPREGGIDLLVVEAASAPAAAARGDRDATGAAVRSVEVVEPDLEAVFLHLTGKALRD